MPQPAVRADLLGDKLEAIGILDGVCCAISYVPEALRTTEGRDWRAEMKEHWRMAVRAVGVLLVETARWRWLTQYVGGKLRFTTCIRSPLQWEQRV